MSNGDTTFEAVGWRVSVQPGAGEIRLEHEATGSVYVLDEDGGLRVPGGADADVDPAAVQAALGNALEAAGGAPDADTTHERVGSDADNGHERAIPDGGQSKCSAVEYDEATGEVTIESDTKISLDAPTVDIESRDMNVDSRRNINLDAEAMVDIASADISLDAQRFIDIVSTSDISFESQRNFSLDAQGVVDISSTKTTVTSSAILTLEGALVKVN